MSQRRVFWRFVLPISWLLTGSVIAVSLVSLAFTGSSSANDDQLDPTGEVPAETVTVGKATVKNTLAITGTIKLDEAQTLNAPVDGVVNWALVKPGDNVSEGQTILIIEAMKTMNQIPAPRAGRVKRILVEDGSPVEFGAPLIIFE